MTVDWQDYQPHPHMALAQYSQGVPLARKPNNLGSVSSSLGAGATTTLITATNQDQPGYQAVIFLTQTNVAAAIPFCILTLTWTDSASGFSATPKQFILPAGFGSASVFYISGPARMDTVTMTLKNLDPASFVSFSFTYTQNSHMWLIDRCAEVTLANVPQFTRANGNPIIGILGSSNPSVGIGFTSNRLMATWTGRCQVTVDDVGGSGSVTVRLTDPGAILGGPTLYSTASSGILWSMTVAPGSPQSFEADLPNGPVVAQTTNNSNTSAISPTVTVTAIDQ